MVDSSKGAGDSRGGSDDDDDDEDVVPRRDADGSERTLAENVTTYNASSAHTVWRQAIDRIRETFATIKALPAEKQDILIMGSVTLVAAAWEAFLIDVFGECVGTIVESGKLSNHVVRPLCEAASAAANLATTLQSHGVFTKANLFESHAATVLGTPFAPVFGGSA
ncbi:MAG: hypothetical protein IPK82_23245, partial [Polyangiaceae bacterium]|nr:hypothetical protein [Polyangiaceae bacterium]